MAIPTDIVVKMYYLITYLHMLAGKKYNEEAEKAFLVYQHSMLLNGHEQLHLLLDYQDVCSNCKLDSREAEPSSTAIYS